MISRMDLRWRAAVSFRAMCFFQPMTDIGLALDGAERRLISGLMSLFRHAARRCTSFAILLLASRCWILAGKW